MYKIGTLLYLGLYNQGTFFVRALRFDQDIYEGIISSTEGIRRAKFSFPYIKKAKMITDIFT